MLKNFTLSAVFLFAMIFTSKAQFTIDNDTLWTDGSADEFELVAYVKIKNITKKPDTIIWTRTLNTIPSTWTSAVCDIIQCYGVTVNSAEFILDSAREASMSFHFYPASNKGMGKMVVRFERKSDPSYYVDIVTTTQAYGLSVQTIRNPSLNIFPNPAINFILIGNEFIKEGTFEIVNILGEKVMGDSFTGSRKIDISNLNKGIYFVNVWNGDLKASGKLIVE